MSFQNKGLWMKNTGAFPDGEIPYDNSSRDEPKRPHQWFLDASDAELFPIKKSAVEGSNGRPISVVPNMNLSWETPSFQEVQSVAGHFTDRLFGSELPRTIDFGGRNFQSSVGNLNIGRRDILDQYGTDPSIGLSMSHTMEDPAAYLSYGGLRKVKVNQVKDPDSSMSMQMGNTFSRGDCNAICFNGFQEAPETNPQRCRSNRVKDSGNGMPIQMGNNSNRFENNTISFNGFQDEHDTSVYSGRMNHTKDNDNVMSTHLGDTFHKGDNNTISFGGSPVDAGMSNYDMLVRQSSHQLSEVLKEREVADTLNTDLVVSATPALPVSSAPSKPKSEPKEKPPLNSFPSNVRSLLNTGILDGVPVKYISWQHEELEGVIKGCGYMCGCNSCNYSKILNAYEFEKHAGAKTKHPNNHIYFENGKTVYSIVQELKTTPPKMLFDAIEHCTGSLINQKAFKTWKESYQAASRELERIYGKDLLKLSTEGE